MLLESERLTLKAYLELPSRKLLNHRFDMEEDFLAGYVSRFLKGERYDIEFQAFSQEELEIVNEIINQNFNTKDGKDLQTAVLLTRIACNIMNKYKI